MSDVFISYSRKDIAFARILFEALEAKHLDTWIDWRDIPPVAEWLDEVYRAIEGADTFVFVVSQTSIHSEVCHLEIQHAVEHHKRLVPIVLFDVDPKALPPAVAARNWIPFREQDDFQESFDKLLKAVQTDLEWVRAHTRLTVRAREWDSHGRERSLLLRGTDLEDAEQWQSQGGAKEPKPTALQGEYILAGRRAEARRQRMTLGAAAVGLVVAVVLALLAWRQRDAALDAKRTAQVEAEMRATSQLQAQAAAATAVAEAQVRATAQAVAEHQRQTALARQLAAESQMVWDRTGTGLVRSALLAVESLRRQPTLEGDQALRLGLSLLPHAIAQMAHGKSIRSVAFSPGGQLLASVAANSVQVWEISTGRRIAGGELSRPVIGNRDFYTVAFSPDGHFLAAGVWYDYYDHDEVLVWPVAGQPGAPVAQVFTYGTSFAFSPDWSLLVVEGRDNTVQVWDVATSQEVARMNPDSAVIALAFSPDGLWVLSGCVDGSARIWDARSGKEVARLESDMIWPVSHVAFGTWRVVAARSDGAIRVWEPGTFRLMREMRHSFGQVIRTLAIAEGGMTVISAGTDDSVRVWGDGAELVRVQYDDPVWDAAVSPDGRFVATASGSSTFSVWELDTGRETARLEQQGLGKGTVAFSPGGQSVASGGRDGMVRVWAAGDWSERLTRDGMVESVAFSPDGRLVAFADHGPTQVWEPGTEEKVLSMQNAGANAVVFSPDGRWVASSYAGWNGLSDDGGVSILDVDTAQSVAFLRHVGARSAAFSPDGKRIASVGRDSIVRVWEVATGQEVASVTQYPFPTGAVFSPDGEWVLSWGGDDSARVWGAANGKERSRMMHDDWVTGAAFSADGKWVVTGGNDDTSRVWEAATAREIARVTQRADVTVVAFSPDGREVVSGAADGSLWVWEAATGQVVATATHEDRVTDAAWSPDGRYVASASRDGSVRVWASATGTQVARMNHEDWVNDLEFSRDGRRIVTGGRDHVVRVWLWRPADLIADACARLSRNLTLEEWRAYVPDEPCRPTCPNLSDLCSPPTPTPEVSLTP